MSRARWSATGRRANPQPHPNLSPDPNPNPNPYPHPSPYPNPNPNQAGEACGWVKADYRFRRAILFDGELPHRPGPVTLTLTLTLTLTRRAAAPLQPRNP